ncbi:hypothetical protein BH23VER1_BH23VER1_19680 [soil metagenome]
MEPPFEKLLVLLAEGGIRFVLVGGLAVTLHGYVRLTEDVDILIDDDPDNIAAILAILRSYGEGFAGELERDDFTDSEGAIRIIEEVEQCQIDIFTRIGGRKYADVLSDAATFPLGDACVRYASKESLIQWKEHSEREKDRLDALVLRRLLGS